MQAGWAESKAAEKISFKKETRINNNCNDFEFGRNDISVSTESGVGERWKEAGGEIAVKDKYIFSSSEQGKNYYVFSKAFEFPYKISDLIFLSSKEYCFIDAPASIVRDIEGLGVKNIKTENCSAGAVEVCFNSDCDIKVSGDDKDGIVVKDDGRYEYVGNLLYGAIIADKDIYDCNVKRLLYRAGMIADVYIDAGQAREARGIGTNLIPHLIFYKAVIMNASSDDLISLRRVAEDMDRVNNKEVVGLW